MFTSQVLRHLNLGGQITPFAYASSLQSTLVSQFLSHKALTSATTPPSPIPPAPTPTLLTFVPTPVYTTGRRELGTLTPHQINVLKQPLHSPNAPLYPVAEVEETLRGGQITFHGPGQLVIYPILDLKSIRSKLWPKGLSVRCYVNLLEETTIRTLSRFGIKGLRTENPGVWVDETKKIAALGVHLRRNITSYGVGLNIHTDLRWFDRIVACGLEGKQTTNMMEEGLKSKGDKTITTTGSNALMPENVANLWALEFADGLWGEKDVVQRMTGHELLEDLARRQSVYADKDSCLEDAQWMEWAEQR